MSHKLSSALYEAGLLTLDQLQEAITEQAVRGGSLDSVLLEEGLAETNLLRMLEQCTGFPALTRELYALVTENPVEKMPLARAESLGICPIKQQAQEILVAVNSYNDEVSLEELSYEFDFKLIPFCAPEVRLAELRHLVYRAALSPRFQSLLERLGPAPTRTQLEGSSSARGSGERSRRLVKAVTQGFKITQPLSTQAVRVERGGLSRIDIIPAATSSPSNFEPIVEKTVRAMNAADSRDRLMSSLLEGVAEFLDPVHVYVVAKEDLVGRFAIREGALDDRAIRDYSISIANTVCCKEATESGEILVDIPLKTSFDATTAQRFIDSGFSASTVVLVPIQLKRRTVCLIVGSVKATVVAEELLPPLSRLSDEASTALAELIVRTKGRKTVTAQLTPVKSTSTKAK